MADLLPEPEPEPGTIAWTMWQRRRGCGDPLPSERDEQRRALDAENLAALRSGERQSISTRRLDFNPRTGAYTSKVRRRGGEWSKPRVVAVSGTHAARIARCPAARSRGPRGPVRRPAVRRRVTRARAPTSDSRGSEPGPGPDDGPGDEFIDADAHYAAQHVVALYAQGLTRARFHATTLLYAFGRDRERADNAPADGFPRADRAAAHVFCCHVAEAAR